MSVSFPFPVFVALHPLPSFYPSIHLSIAMLRSRPCYYLTMFVCSALYILYFMCVGLQEDGGLPCLSAKTAADRPQSGTEWPSQRSTLPIYKPLFEENKPRLLAKSELRRFLIIPPIWIMMMMLNVLQC